MQVLPKLRNEPWWGKILCVLLCNIPMEDSSCVILAAWQYLFFSSTSAQTCKTSVTALHWFSLSFYFLISHFFLDVLSLFHYISDRKLKQNWWRTYQKCHRLQKFSTNQHYLLFWVSWDSHTAVKLSYVREENTWAHKSDGRRKRRDRNIKQQWK